MPRVESGFGVDFQMKSSTRSKFDGDDVVYDLEAKTYNDLVLREAETTTCILILLCLPQDEEQWLTRSESEMVLRRCCYWYHLSGKATQNSRTERIRIPRKNLLTVEAMREILQDERRRRLGASK